MPHPIRQLAYFTDDIERAAAEHSARFGSGPFLVRKSIPVQRALIRGVGGVFDHGSAYGQWGEVMVEFVQQNTAGPSPFHDMYPEGSGRFGLHHVAIFVDDLRDGIARYNAQGFQTALLADLTDTFSFAMMDTVQAYGHMVELYEPVTELVAFYDHLKVLSQTFDGTDPVRLID